MRRSTPRAAAAVALLALAFAACSSSTEPAAEQPFPNSVGNSWTYAVHDTVSGQARVDTATVRITLRTSTIAPGEAPDTAPESRPAMMWEISFRGRTDSLLVLRYQNRAELNPMRMDGLWLYRRIQFPLTVGNEWDSPAGHDVVAAQQLIRVPAGEYEPAFRIESSDRERLHWYVPGVGSVAFERTDTSQGVPLRQRWELVRFTLV
jgi:hypothetical protein